ncbi:MAG: helix-turn-helix domain-containing protein [Thermomicrobiales bacterium]
MSLFLTPTERAELEAAAANEPRVRRWKRYQAMLLRAEGQTVAAVAAALRCSMASVYAWTAAWRRAGVVGLAEGLHGGGKAKLGPEGEAVLTELLSDDPQTRGHQATGWTVPLLRTELAQAGYAVGDRTIRRALHRLGFRWKRPRYVLGRPDPAYAEKKGRSSLPPMP